MTWTPAGTKDLQPVLMLPSHWCCSNTLDEGYGNVGQGIKPKFLLDVFIVSVSVRKKALRCRKFFM